MEPQNTTAHNKINLDHELIAQRFLAGESSDVIAQDMSVSQVVIFRHLHEYAGDGYETMVYDHWKALAAQRVVSRSGKRVRGGARWFTLDEEAEVVAYYLVGNYTYDEIAKHFGCSRVVIKKLIARCVDPETRKAKQSAIRTGRILVEYIKITCPVCNKVREVPPWKDRQGLVYCSRACKGVATSGEACTWLYGKPNHAVGQWYEVNGRRQWFRSRWEYGVALHLDTLDIAWAYEPVSFPIRAMKKATTYTPDFYLPNEDLYIEVKGWWRPAYIEKHNAFRLAYSHVSIDVWGKDVLVELGIINRKGRVLIKPMQAG